jgi:hypothetical protein
MADRIEIEILEDGEIRFSTDSISKKNHASADEFFAQIEKLAGGKTVKQKKKALRRRSTYSNYAHNH